MRHSTLAFITAILLALPASPAPAASPIGGPLRVDSVVVTLIDQVDLAAREAGRAGTDRRARGPDRRERSALGPARRHRRRAGLG